MRPCPQPPKELVEWLEAAFPDRAPNVKDTEREIWMAVGAVTVVRKLRNEYERATQTALTSTA